MADGSVRPSEECHAEDCAVMESRKLRKEGLPKREPPWSAGGHWVMVLSIEDSMDNICSIASGAPEVFTADIFLSAAANESEKTK